MELTIDVGSYFDQDDIRDMVEDEMRRAVRSRAEEFCSFYDIRDMVLGFSREIVKKLVEEQDPEVFSTLAAKTREVIDDMSCYTLFHETEVRRTRDGIVYRKTRGLQMLESIMEELEPRLKERAWELVEEKLDTTIDAHAIIDAATDAFYEKLCEQLKGGN